MENWPSSNIFVGKNNYYLEHIWFYTKTGKHKNKTMSRSFVCLPPNGAISKLTNDSLTYSNYLQK